VGAIAHCACGTRAGCCIATLPDADGWPDGQDFDPTGRHLASVTTDGAVALWDIRTGQRAGTFRDYQGEAQVVAYHPRGDCLAIATDAYTIACWYPGERRVETISCGYDTSIISLRFDPSGSALIAGMGREDVPIRVWDLVPPHATIYVRGRSDEVVSIAVSPAGRYLACGSTGRTAAVETGGWNTKHLLDALAAHLVMPVASMIGREPTGSRPQHYLHHAWRYS
jgi:WD40 repeat protein